MKKHRVNWVNFYQQWHALAEGVVLQQLQVVASRGFGRALKVGFLALDDADGGGDDF